MEFEAYWTRDLGSISRGLWSKLQQKRQKKPVIECEQIWESLILAVPSQTLVLMNIECSLSIYIYRMFILFDTRNLDVSLKGIYIL